jgi:hypothetical protein
MSGESQRKRSLAWLWGVVPVVIAAELFMQWRIPRQEPSAEEWRSAAAFVRAEKRPDDLVVIAPAWATQARMYLGDALPIRDFGKFDLDRYARVFELSLGGARAGETRGLKAEKTTEFGRLAVTRYGNPGRRELRYDFVGSAWRGTMPTGGKASAHLVIDHWFQPRYAVTIPLGPTPKRVVYKDVPLGGTLRVYAVIGYREGRFDKGEPVRFAVYVNDERVIDRSVANFAPVEPIEVPLVGQGTGTIAFEASARENLKREFSFAAALLGGKGAGR